MPSENDIISALRDKANTIQHLLSELEAETRRNVEARTRAVSVMAKNLKPGDEIEWPYGWGRAEINGWGQMGQHVTISMLSGKLATFGADERVRVYR
jgi:hypothetical protein